MDPKSIDDGDCSEVVDHSFVSPTSFLLIDVEADPLPTSRNGVGPYSRSRGVSGLASEAPSFCSFDDPPLRIGNIDGNPELVSKEGEADSLRNGEIICQTAIILPS